TNWASQRPTIIMAASCAPPWKRQRTQPVNPAPVRCRDGSWSLGAWRRMLRFRRPRGGSRELVPPGRHP
ncbi:MAG: hypothetical protein ACRDYX_14995, partial [Egibacteraceae bacterium]